MHCLELKYYDKLGDMPIDRHYCLDVWDKNCLIDSFWFTNEEARTQFIKDCYEKDKI